VDGSPMDTRAWAAIAASHLGGLPPQLMDRLLAQARRLEVSASAVIHREGEQIPHVEVVVDGLVRVYVTAPDGRTLTVRYCRAGASTSVRSSSGAARGFTTCRA